jgi:UDP-N-acetyl-D-galactosamine dehydrogenase
MEAEVVDPWVNAQEAKAIYGLDVLAEIPCGGRYSVVVAAVAHRQFANQPAEKWRALLEPTAVLVDLKGIVPRELGALRL